MSMESTTEVTEPILVMAFNRPDHLQVLINRLRDVKAAQIYVAIDGPRSARQGEAEHVQKCRDLVRSIDWPCNVTTLFQDNNLGCGMGVSTAITWFFSHVERGIILEDDIIPDPSFFPYCTELLDRYENDDRVFAISGCNFVPASAQTHANLPTDSVKCRIFGAGQRGSARGLSTALISRAGANNFHQSACGHELGARYPQVSIGRAPLKFWPEKKSTHGMGSSCSHLWCRTN